MKHTKGPWHIENAEDGEYQAIVAINDLNEYGGKTIAITSSVEMDFDSGLANARLIAAAPDMLEALENLVSDSECPDHIAAYLLPVIVKAKGKL